MSGKHTQPPYELGSIVSAKELALQCSKDGGGQFIEIDAEHHGAIAIVVWRMEDDLRSEMLEETARFFVRACNAYAPMLAALDALQRNPNDPRAHRAALDVLTAAGAA